MDKWDRVTDYCCKSCMYYSPKTKILGRCKRNAPTMAGFPVVYAESDWCGEHKRGTNPTKKAAVKTEILENAKKNAPSEEIRCMLNNMKPHPTD